MGYSEVPCKLCGVSFNIGRVRRPDEPHRAGWSPLCGEPASLPEDWNGGRQWENFISKDFVKWRRCKSSTGCQDIERVVASVDPSDDEDDDDYMYESQADDEPLEYASDVALEEDHSEGDMGSSASEPDDAFTDPLSTALDEDSKSVDEGVSSLTNKIGVYPEGSTENEPQRKLTGSNVASDSNDSESTDWMEDWEECQKLEHLAGPRCKHVSGYCGFNISPEEMKGCTTLQCLVRKTPEWTSEPDDQDFEQSGEYYLSGLSGQMPSRDIGGPRMTPPRHGAKDLYPDVNESGVPRMTPPRHGAKDLYPDVNESGVPMPFHPTCFEIFTRACRLRTDSIDIVGLMDWRDLESSWETDRSFPHHEAVKESSEQEWQHRPRYEWLAANPVLVPGLTALLRLAVSRSKPSYDDIQGRPGSEDPFSKLPREIADAILDLISPVDVAALRLAGLARFLAIESWYGQLREEMPWLWEVWDTALPSFWATITVSALSAEIKHKEEAEKQRLAAKAIIHQELPEIAEIWDAENANEGDKSYAVCGKEGLEETIILPKDGTNWCRVYYEVKTNWKALKGLQNRERIWRDVEEILRRIDGYRSEGRIA